MRLKPWTCALLVVVVGADVSSCQRVSQPLKSVAALAPKATLVVEDEAISFFSVDRSDPPRKVFLRSPGGHQTNSAIAVGPAQQDALFSDGATLFRIDRAGQVTPLLPRLNTLNLGQGAHINWHIGAQKDRATFAVLGDAGPSAFLVELTHADSTTRTFEVAFPRVVVVDGERRLAYLPAAREPFIEVLHLADGGRERLPTSEMWWHLDLAADARRLLLSSDPSDACTPVSILDVETRRETATQALGGYATWLSADSFLYVVGENELWRHDVPSDRSELLFSGRPSHQHQGSYAIAPVVSPSGRLIAFGFATADGDTLSLKTALIDVARREVRVVDGWWHNVAWWEER